MDINTLKEMILDIVDKVGYNPMTFVELQEATNSIEEDLLKATNELMESFDLFISKKKDKYLSKRLANVYKGTITIKNDFFGFVTNEFYPDFYISSEEFNGAMNKDYILYKVVEDPFSASGYQGIVLNVIKRNYEYLVGELYYKNNKYYLKTIEKYINKPIIVNVTNNAKSKDIVRVKINQYGEVLKCSVVDILGDTNSLGIDITQIAASYGVLREFTEDVLKEASKLTVDMDSERKRRHTYDAPIFTIDSESAKDLDDAVSIRILSNGNYELGVYIADVSYYVTENNLLDKEALARGTSVYLLDRVIPMLPTRLSNDLCSLNPNEEKLVIACIMELDNDGNLIESRIEEGIIKTTKRLSYEKCNDVLVNGLVNHPDYECTIESLKLMVELKDKLNQKRRNRGSIDFDTIEPKIILNELGEAIDIIAIDRGESERIIEEFMILANETVASFITQMDLPFIYRVHDKPDNIKFQILKGFVGNLGYKILSSHPKEIQKLLDSLDSKDIYLKNSIIRLMAKAVYSSDNIGHFGLASECYTHFTSPIRRYPDLLVHRLLRKYIFSSENMLDENEYQDLKNKIEDIASQASERERAAMECEFAVDDMKKAEYMSTFIGTTYDATISSVLRFGIFVGLDNTVEGLIRSDNLNMKGFYFDNNGSYVNKRTNKKLKMGDKVKVRLTNANKKTSEIDFTLVYNNDGVKHYGKYKGHHKK